LTPIAAGLQRLSHRGINLLQKNALGIEKGRKLQDNHNWFTP
jgi:hypothetical protein